MLGQAPGRAPVRELHREWKPSELSRACAGQHQMEALTSVGLEAGKAGGAAWWEMAHHPAVRVTSGPTVCSVRAELEPRVRAFGCPGGQQVSVSLPAMVFSQAVKNEGPHE